VLQLWSSSRLADPVLAQKAILEKLALEWPQSWATDERVRAAEKAQDLGSAQHDFVAVFRPIVLVQFRQSPYPANRIAALQP